MLDSAFHPLKPEAQNICDCLTESGIKTPWSTCLDEGNHPFQGLQINFIKSIDYGGFCKKVLCYSSVYGNLI
jgi:hypothetical protein